MTARNPALDALRAVAILGVLTTHLSNSFLGGTAFARGVSVGGRGVDLFFVLSGWLLGSQLFREANATGTVDVRRFWVRRWLRTLPAYYAVLFATFAQFAAQGKAELIDWGYVFFLQNYYEKPPFLGVTWSLCVEEHFYLVIAPLVLVAYRFRWAIVPMVGVVLVLIGLHVAGFYVHRPNYHITETHVLFEQCGVGVLLAWLAVNRPAAWARLCRAAKPFALVSLALIAVAVLNRTVWDWWLPDWGTGGWAVIFGTGIVAANVVTMKPSRALGFVALRAYSLYLVHVEAIMLAKKLPLPPVIQAVVAVVGAFVLAEVLYRAVERPFNRLRDRWVPRPATGRPALSPQP